MPYPLLNRVGLVLLCLCCIGRFAGLSFADETPGSDSDVNGDFRQQFDRVAVPFLENYCNDCHSGDEPEAGFGLDHVEKLASVNDQRDAWLHVVEKLRMGEMPPEDELQPTEDEKSAFLQLIESELAKFDCSKNQKPGHVTVRRLNRVEYNNTIRDLIGIDIKPADNFPADDVGGGFDNLGSVLSLPPLLMEKYLEAAEATVAAASQDASFRQRWLTADPKTPAEQVAAERLEAFATRAFRRPLREGELESLMNLFRQAMDETNDLAQSIGFAIQAVLVSPHFLFRIESEGPDDKADQVRPLNDFELATRLSYFLWSSMPDDELFDLASQGKLRDEHIRREQILRMLKDSKSEALIENFAGQWLELRNLAKLSPDPTTYPDFDEDLRFAMAQETKLFFAKVMRENRSVLEFIDSRTTFVNGRLAKHYGLSGVDGDAFREIELPDERRGGILTHASILTLTSNPTRTSPVKRGKWILDNILGEPPPPPPANVPELTEGDTELLGSLRERMKQHRENPECAVCHTKMDALGFGFENFDGIGKWRDRDGRHEIDASGELPGHQSFRGPAELRQILKTQKSQQFVRCLTEKLLTYALGRELTPDDRCTIETIMSKLEQANYRFVDLIVAIADSDAFLVRGAKETRHE